MTRSRGEVRLARRVAFRPFIATLTGCFDSRYRDHVPDVVAVSGGAGGSFLRAVCVATPAMDRVRHGSPWEPA